MAGAFSYWLVRYRRSWPASLVPSVVAPVLYLLVFGHLAREVGGADDRIAFVGPGIVVAAAMLVATAEAGLPVFTAISRQNTYLGMVHTPVGARGIVLGHLAWIALRLVAVGLSLAVLLTVLGVGPLISTLPTVPVAVVTGLAFAGPLMAYSARQRNEAGILAWMRFGATPMLLFGGVLYSVDELPAVLRLPAQVTPLWHGVEVARAAVAGSLMSDGPALALHLGFLSAVAVGGAALAVRSIEREVVG